MKILIILITFIFTTSCVNYKSVHVYPVEKRNKTLHKKAIKDIKKINRYKKSKNKRR
jgi:hypothetical protein